MKNTTKGKVDTARKILTTDEQHASVSSKMI
jgi:hypothetical protein